VALATWGLEYTAAECKRTFSKYAPAPVERRGRFSINARWQLLRGRGVVAVGVGDWPVAHVAVELLVSVRHPLKLRGTVGVSVF
jgi:hypothetical protein